MADIIGTGFLGLYPILKVRHIGEKVAWNGDYGHEILLGSDGLLQLNMGLPSYLCISLEPVIQFWNFT